MRVKKARQKYERPRRQIEGIVTLIVEALSKIKPSDPLRLAKHTARKKRNFSDSSGNSPAKILASRYESKKSIRVKSSQTRPEVLTVTGRKTMGSVSPIRVYLTIMPYLCSGCLVQGTVRLRSTGEGRSLLCSVCTLSDCSCFNIYFGLFDISQNITYFKFLMLKRTVRDVET